MNERFFGQQRKRKPHDASKRMVYRPSSRSISQPSPVFTDDSPVGSSAET